MESSAQGLAEGWARSEGSWFLIRDTFEITPFFPGFDQLGTHWIHWMQTNSGSMAMMPSTLFVCQDCGRPWGRRLQNPHAWVCEMRECFSHGNGSLLFDSDETRDLPMLLINREISIAIRDKNLWNF